MAVDETWTDSEFVNGAAFSALSHLANLNEAAIATKQPLDADLTAIAALTSAADKVPYSTGANTWAMTTLTPFARTVIDDADATTMLTNLTGFTSTVTAAGTTTLTVSSTQLQVFTGTTTQTVKLPTTSILQGARYTILNASTGAVTVQSSAANTIATVTPGTSGTFYAAVATPTAAAHWIYPSGGVAGGGDASTNTATSVDSEVVLFSGTTGKSLKRATGTGIAKITSGVLGTATAGTDYQAADTDLTAIAALTSAANKLPYATGAGTWSLADLTAAARTLLDDVDVTAMRATLGVPSITPPYTSIAVVTSLPGSPDANTVYIVNDGGAPRVATIASSATPTINVDSTDQAEMITLATNVTSVTFSGTPRPGQKLIVVIKSTSSQTFAFGSSVIAGPAPLITATVAGKYHEIVLKYNSTAAKWVCMASDLTGY